MTSSMVIIPNIHILEEIRNRLTLVVMRRWCPSSVHDGISNNRFLAHRYGMARNELSIGALGMVRAYNPLVWLELVIMVVSGIERVARITTVSLPAMKTKCTRPTDQ